MYHIFIAQSSVDTAIQAVELVNTYAASVTAYVVEFTHKILPVIIYGIVFQIVLKKS